MPDYHTAVFDPPPVDIDGDGQTEDLQFVFKSSLRQEYETITDYLAEGGSTIVAVLTDLLEEGQLDGGNRQDLKLDLGGGEHVVQLEAEVSRGAPYQWGTGDGDDVTDATGGDPVKQLQLLDRTLQKATIDSREDNSAILEIGDYATDGAWEPLEVVADNPKLIFDSDQESSTATVSVRFIEIASLGQALDATERTAE